jgi:hypothetical protein
MIEAMFRRGVSSRQTPRQWRGWPWIGKSSCHCCDLQRPVTRPKSALGHSECASWPCSGRKGDGGNVVEGRIAKVQLDRRLAQSSRARFCRRGRRQWLHYLHVVVARTDTTQNTNRQRAQWKGATQGPLKQTSFPPAVALVPCGKRLDPDPAKPIYRRLCEVGSRCSSTPFFWTAASLQHLSNTPPPCTAPVSCATRHRCGCQQATGVIPARCWSARKHVADADLNELEAISPGHPSVLLRRRPIAPRPANPA